MLVIVLFMFLSVIIPSYRPNSWFWQCLSSIRKQTLASDLFETIIVLNGDKEPFYSQIKDYICKNLLDLNINFIYTDKASVSNARNIGIDNAKGKYVTFIDDDDYVSSCYLEELYNLALSGKIGVSNVIAFMDKDNSIVDYYISNLFRKLKERQEVPLMKARSFMSIPVAKILPVEIIGARRFDVRFKNGEDSLFMFSISDKIKKMTLTSSEAIYYRRIREGAATTRKRSVFEKTMNRIKLIGSYISIYIKNPICYNFPFFLSRIVATIYRMLIFARV